MSNSTFDPKRHPVNPAGAKMLRRVTKNHHAARATYRQAVAHYRQLQDGPDRHGPRHTWELA